MQKEEKPVCRTWSVQKNFNPMLVETPREPAVTEGGMASSAPMTRLGLGPLYSVAAALSAITAGQRNPRLPAS